MPKAKNRQRPLLRLRLDPDTLARLARGEPVFFDSLEGLDADVVLVYIAQGEQELDARRSRLADQAKGLGALIGHSRPGVLFAPFFPVPGV
jgi:hypothetical protein